MGIEFGLGQAALNDTATVDFTSAELSAAPKAVLTLIGNGTANGVANAMWNRSVGAVDGTSEYHESTSADDGHSSVDARRGGYARAGTRDVSLGSFQRDDLSHNSFLSNGWRANHNGRSNGGYLAAAGMLGGSDVTVEVGALTLDSGSGQYTESLSNTNLTPNIIIFFSQGDDFGNSSAFFIPSFGIAHDNGTAIVQRMWAMSKTDGDSTSTPSQKIRTDAVAEQYGVWDLTVDSMSQGQFKATLSANASGDEIGYIAIQFDNANLALVDVDLPTSTGVNEQTGPGFQPKAVIQCLSMLTALDTDTSSAEAGVNTLSLFNVNEALCYSWADEYGVGTTNTQSLADSKPVNIDADDGTKAFEGTFSQFTSNGWEINYSTVDGTARKGFALAIGEATADTGTTLTVNDIGHNHIVKNVALSQAHSLTANDITHPHSTENLSLSQAHNITVNDVTHNQTAEDVALSQAHVLNISDITHPHTIENIALTQAHVLSVSDITHPHSTENLSLAPENVLGVNGIIHDQTAQNIVLTQADNLVVNDIGNNHRVENIALTQAHNIVVGDIRHNQTTEVVSLVQANIVSITDVTHSHTTEGVSLIQANVLSINEISHVHTMETLQLVQSNVLSPNDVTHSQITDSISLSGTAILSISDISQAHTSESFAITQNHILSVDRLLHNHMVEELHLTADSTLVVVDAQHVHNIDNVIFAGTVFWAGRLVQVKPHERIVVVDRYDRITVVVPTEHLISVLH